MVQKLNAKMAIERRQAPETPFSLTFEVVNKGDKDIYVLKHHTPLEGMFSDCFEVKRDGNLVPYDGPLVKRRPPTEDDYIKILPGKSITAEVDLSSCYQVSVPGDYEVAFRGPLPDVATKTELRAKAKSKEVKQTPVDVKVRVKKFKVKSGSHGRATAGEAARRQQEDVDFPKAKQKPTKKKKSAKAVPPTIVGGTASQKVNTKKAHKDGYDLTVAALQGLKNDAKYKEWFGSHTNTRFNKVKDTYTKIRDGMKNKTFTYDLSGTGCQPNWYAYTYKNTTKIWMCGAFWSALATGTDSKAGVVLHEHSHASASTDDIKYGQSDCRSLATNKPNDAVKNADSFEYYAGG